MKKMVLKAVRNTLIVAALLLYALFLLLCMDNENSYRPGFLDVNPFTSFYLLTGITLELRQGSWLLLTAALGAVGFFSVAWAICPPIRQKVTGGQSGDRKFTLVYYTVTFLLFAVCFLVFQFLTPLFRESVLNGDAVYAAVIAFGLALAAELLTVGFLHLAGRSVVRLIRYMKGGSEPASPPPPPAKQTVSEFLAEAHRYPSPHRVFTDLGFIDDYYKTNRPDPLPEEDQPGDLMALTLGFQSYLSSVCGLSFGLDSLRAFFSSMAASRLVILDGGTGAEKTLLPKFFCQYIRESAFYLPVQPGWKDRTPVFGTYYPPNNSYLETAFLRRLYNASYREDHLNFMVFEGFDLSRPDRYLGDLVSSLEWEGESRAVDLLPLSLPGELPARFNSQGRLVVPDNTWFFGALAGESGLPLPEKICDRAMTVTFSDHNTKLTAGVEADPVSLSAGRLLGLFEAARRDPACALSEEELKTFLKLCDRVYDSFGVPCGNRFVGQLKKAVPVFVACGGEKATALDFLFASKILRRAVKKPAAGREAEIRALTRCIREHYGKNVFVRSAAMLAEWTAPEVKDD